MNHYARPVTLVFYATCFLHALPFLSRNNHPFIAVDCAKLIPAVRKSRPQISSSQLDIDAGASNAGFSGAAAREQKASVSDRTKVSSAEDLLNQLLPEAGNPRRERQLQTLCKIRCDALCAADKNKLNDDADNERDEDGGESGSAAKMVSSSARPRQQKCKQNCMKRFSNDNNEKQCLDWVDQCEEIKNMLHCWNAGLLKIRHATVHSLQVEWEPPSSTTRNTTAPQYAALIAYGRGQSDTRLKLLSTITSPSRHSDESVEELHHRWTALEVDDPNRSELELTKICSVDGVSVRLIKISSSGIVAVSKSYEFIANLSALAAEDDEEGDNIGNAVTDFRHTPLLWRSSGSEKNLPGSSSNRDVTTSLEWNLPKNWSQTDLQYYEVGFHTDYCTTSFVPDFVPESRRPKAGRIDVTVRLDCRYVFEVTAVSVCNRFSATASIKVDAACANIANAPAHLPSMCKTSQHLNVNMQYKLFISTRNETQPGNHNSNKLESLNFIGHPPLSLTDNTTWTRTSSDVSGKTARVTLTWPKIVATSTDPKNSDRPVVQYKLFWGPVEAPFKQLPTLFQLVANATESHVIKSQALNARNESTTGTMSAELLLHNLSTDNKFGYKVIAYVETSNIDKQLEHAAALSMPAVMSAEKIFKSGNLFDSDGQWLYGWRVAFITIIACTAGVVLACCCCQWRGPRWCRDTLGLSNLIFLNRQSSTNTYINTGGGSTSGTRTWNMTPLTASTASQLHRLGRPVSSATGASSTAYKTMMFDNPFNKQQRQFVRGGPRSHLISRLSQASVDTNNDSIITRPLSVTLGSLPTPPPVPSSTATTAFFRNNPFEIPRCQLQLGECLGRGAFGQVVKAKYFVPTSTTRDEYDDFFGREDSGISSARSGVTSKNALAFAASEYYEIGDGSAKRASLLLRQTTELCSSPPPAAQQPSAPDEIYSRNELLTSNTLENTATEFGIISRSNSKCDVRRVESGDSAVTIMSTADHTSSATSSTSSSSFILTVAIKSLRTAGDSNDDEKLRFDREIDIMSSTGQHAHVVTFIGYCWLSDQLNPMSFAIKGLVLEYCALGDLANYLRKAREQQTEQQQQKTDPNGNSQDAQQEIVPLVDQLSYARQIAIAMEWLSAQDIVHRDVAARNVLLKSKHTVKITDFGLARRLSDSTQSLIYDCALVHRNRLPVKWLAIESLEQMIFSSASDVWAFAIALYEILTLGLVPYNNVANADVLLLLKSGRRAEKPQACSLELYRLMVLCWKEQPNERPTFSTLVIELENLMQKLLLTENHYVELPIAPK